MMSNYVIYQTSSTSDQQKEDDSSQSLKYDSLILELVFGLSKQTPKILTTLLRFLHYTSQSCWYYNVTDNSYSKNC